MKVRYFKAEIFEQAKNVLHGYKQGVLLIPDNLSRGQKAIIVDIEVKQRPPDQQFVCLTWRFNRLRNVALVTHINMCMNRPSEEIFKLYLKKGNDKLS